MNNKWVLRAGAAVFVLAVWQWAMGGGRVDPTFAAPPTKVLASIPEVVTGDLYVGVLMGLVIGSVRQLDIAFGPYIFAFFATPFPALIPLFILVFGLGFWGKAAIVFTLVWIAVLLQTIAGVKAVDDRYLEVGRSLGSTGQAWKQAD